MFISNAIKVVGCLLMLFGAHPLLAYAHRRPRRRGVLAGQVRHPDRAAAELAAGQGQRLDRGPDDPVDHLRRGARRPAARPRRSRGRLLSFDMPVIDTGIATAPEAAIALIVSLYIDRRALQPAHPAHRGAAAAARRTASAPLVRDFSNCNARLWNDKLGQISLATTTLFWGVSGNLRVIVFAWAAAALGYSTTRRVVAGRRGRDRHRRRRGRRLDADAARPGDQGDPARHRHGRAGDRPERHHQRLARGAVPDRARRHRRLPRGADERPAAAPRRQPDGRRPLDRRAELQRAGLHPRPRRVLHRHDALRPLGLHRDRGLRPAGRPARCG